MTVRLRVRVGGVVQGVGFRPFVYRLATELSLGGFVRNDEHGVVIEIAGTDENAARFLSRLSTDSPPLSQVERIDHELLEAGVHAFVDAGEQYDANRFAILESESAHAGLVSALVPPDIATCDECIAELNDPANRRYQFPFTNCTNCGPRFTIMQSVPYDRRRTTMAPFTMCSLCQSEFDDPGDRRFHAQPNACPACGPTAQLVNASGAPVGEPGTMNSVRGAAHAIMRGAIVAIKGVGGFHVACLASSEQAVQCLRDRKHRPDKPFAVMVPDVEWAARIITTDALATSLLQSRERPIVLARRIAHQAVAHNVAPRLHELGVLLPYSPLHELLLQQCGAPLVMTSGNLSDEPVAFRNADALERLSGIADVFLMHNREIETPTDDSVVRIVAVGHQRRPMMIRRSRGYAPAVLALPVSASVHLLACGAELKNAYCVAKGARAWVGPHVGDLANVESRDAFARGASHHERLLAVEPRIFVHDLHPGYASTRYALDRADNTPGATTVGVQHHHAHFAACLAEHGVRGPAGGVILDGTGLGADGTLWGGEILFGSLASFSRRAHLWPVALPGGEAAIREPWRMACAWLCELADTSAARTIEERRGETGGAAEPEMFSRSIHHITREMRDRTQNETHNNTPSAARSETPPVPRALEGRVTPHAWRTAARIARHESFSPRTTSMGRLLDALSAICGVATTVTYEGQAAIELEALADPAEQGTYHIPLLHLAQHTVIDVRSLVSAVVWDTERGEPVSTIAARIHNALAAAISECCVRVLPPGSDVALSGGVFQNVLLLQRVTDALDVRGFRPLVPHLVPPNDGGIAFGQAAVAASTCV